MEPPRHALGHPGLTPRRIVALGASNLTRGLQPLVSAARSEWGREVEVRAALGLGRSYGLPSRILVRGLPGILQSGLWRELTDAPPAPTRALVTDVGNDILYGIPPGQIVDWVAECIDRLQGVTRDVVLTDLPLASVRGLGSGRFLLFRSLLFPQCRLSLAQVVERAEAVNEGLLSLAVSRGARYVRLRSEWYGFDPIHIRPSLWRQAWAEILGVEVASAGGGILEGLRLFSLFPERQWLLGLETRTPQAGVALRRGGRVWLY